jgi:hypothetical protein
MISLQFLQIIRESLPYNINLCWNIFQSIIIISRKYSK